MRSGPRRQSNRMRASWTPRLLCVPLVLAIGCPVSPEDGRGRGGGPGADGGNYLGKPVEVPGKLRTPLPDAAKASTPS